GRRVRKLPFDRTHPPPAGDDPGGVRRGGLPPPAADQAALRPGEPIPAEHERGAVGCPQTQPGLILRPYRCAASANSRSKVAREESRPISLVISSSTRSTPDSLLRSSKAAEVSR